MSNATTKEQVLTVGLDLGDRYIHVCVLDKDGEIVENRGFLTNGQLSNDASVQVNRYVSS